MNFELPLTEVLKLASTCQRVPAELCQALLAGAVPRGLQPQRGSLSGAGDPGLEAALGNIRLHAGLLVCFSIRYSTDIGTACTNCN